MDPSLCAGIAASCCVNRQQSSQGVQCVSRGLRVLNTVTIAKLIVSYKVNSRHVSRGSTVVFLDVLMITYMY